jgi:hypothetical protein
MNVRRIEWTFHTSSREFSGTDSPVSVEILRDGTRLAYVWQEPGNTPRLSRGEVATYLWTFQNLSGVGVAVSGQAVPYTESFPSGFTGHLKVVLKIWGDDLWRVGTIESSVVEGQMKFIPGTIDSWQWVETPHAVTFLGEDVLSTDSSEGVVTLTLNY